MAKRRLTLKRIDPWSVLKFGFIANIALLAIVLLGGAVVWFFVRRLGLIESVCEIAIDVGFLECGVNGGNLFRAALLLGALGVVVQTGVWVFLAFLHNLIADLVGGLAFTYADESPAQTAATGGSAVRRSEGDAPVRRAEPAAATASAGARQPASSASGTPGGSVGASPSPRSSSGGSGTDTTASQPTERRESDIFASHNPSSGSPSGQQRPSSGDSSRGNPWGQPRPSEPRESDARPAPGTEQR